MNRRIDIGKVPFVGWDLAIRVEIPLAGENVKLLFSEFRVDHRERDTMESSIPSSKEGIFPFIGLYIRTNPR
jgi:hypothetical protein